MSCNLQCNNLSHVLPHSKTKELYAMLQQYLKNKTYIFLRRKSLVAAAEYDGMDDIKAL